MIKHKKPAAFYDEFTRKGPGQKTTHYCPGCGHGVVHKMMAEAITDLEIQDQVVFMSPVGCSVFLYYYMDTGNIQCPHGRAPAVATGVTRSLDDAIVISYQGDGDLGGIGMGEVIHAANRGENMAVIFINNAIYGMTGGQMAPTTLIGQESKTTPLGRDAGRDGLPIKMCEVMSSIDAPVYIERTSLGTPASVLKTRKAVFKALKNQKEKKGFSFVEILSPCPINWRMDPIESRKWLRENLEPFYPVKNFRDIDKQDKGQGRLPFLNDDALLELLDINVGDSDDLAKKIKKIGEHKVKIAGFGGQGIMSVGVLLANCAKEAGYNSTWLPSYGAEMRGGTAYASIVISDETIGSPLVDLPDVLIAMNAPSLDKFENDVVSGGTIIVNSSLVSRKVKRDDVKAYYMPATEMANKVGLTATAAVIILTAYTKITNIYELNTLKEVLPLSIKKKKYIEINERAITSGELFYDDNPLS
ncbi:MAG TPA: 2-oxoacid:acceptor oxidoreductase family protein [Victivallales bacterium]|nr:2-oxoacid:acceptor oxidoreductase family protein [Victivallales bacterium]